MQRRFRHSSKAGNEQTAERRRVEADELRLVLAAARKLAVIPFFRESQAVAPSIDKPIGPAVGGAADLLAKPLHCDLPGAAAGDHVLAGQTVESHDLPLALGPRERKHAASLPRPEHQKETQSVRQPGVGDGAEARRKHATTGTVDQAEGLGIEIRLDGEIAKGHPALARQVEMQAAEIQDPGSLRRMCSREVHPGVLHLEQVRLLACEVDHRSRGEVRHQAIAPRAAQHRHDAARYRPVPSVTLLSTQEVPSGFVGWRNTLAPTRGA